MTTFLDTNIIIALLDETHKYNPVAEQRFEELKADGPMIVSDIVYCEVSVAMNSREELDMAISSLGLERTPCSDEALFRAGKAFKRYRDKNKGPKPGVLPDFLIGALADVEGIRLWTTNSKDYVGYFPDLELIVPTKEEYEGTTSTEAEDA